MTADPTPTVPSVQVIQLADNVLVDRIGISDRHRDHLILVTDPTVGQVLAALRVTPTAAAALVTALMPIATTAPRVSGGLLSVVTDEARQ